MLELARLELGQGLAGTGLDLGRGYSWRSVSSSRLKASAGPLPRELGRAQGDPLEEGDPGASVGVGGECRLQGGVFGEIFRRERRKKFRGELSACLDVHIDARLAERNECLPPRCFT